RLRRRARRPARRGPVPRDRAAGAVLAGQHGAPRRRGGRRRHRRRSGDAGPDPRPVLPGGLRLRSAGRRTLRRRGLLSAHRRPEAAGRVARQTAPVIRQLFVAAPGGPDPEVFDGDAFERALFLARRRAEIASGERLVVPTCSSRTIVYKGMLSAPQLPHYYPDLVDERFET